MFAKSFWIFAIGFFSSISVFAQNIPIGTWRSHFYDNDQYLVCEVEDKIYFGSRIQLTRFDQQQNYYELLSRIDGFTGAGATAMAYNSALKTLLIGYRNGNIDIFNDAGVKILSDVSRRGLTGDLSINQISFNGNNAYLATQFGVIVVDLIKQQIKNDILNLGSSGNQIPVFGVAVQRDTLWAATQEGLKYIHLQKNLRDINNWISADTSNFEKIDPEYNLPNGKSVTKLESYNGNIYAVALAKRTLTSNGNDSTAILVKKSKRFERLPIKFGTLPKTGINPVGSITYLTISRNKLILIRNKRIETYSPDGLFEATYDSNIVSQPQSVAFDDNGKIWIADINGQYSDAYGSLSRISPAGNFGSIISGLSSGNNLVISTTAIIDQSSLAASYAYFGFNIHQNGTWKTYSPWKPTGGAWSIDLSDAKYNPVTKAWYFSSHGSGLLKYNEDQTFEQFFGASTPLFSFVPNDGRFYRVLGLGIDGQGNVWCTNNSFPKDTAGIHVLKPDNTWGPSLWLKGTAEGSNLHNIVIDKFNQKWVSVYPERNSSNGSLVVVKEKNMDPGVTTDFDFRFLGIDAANGGLPCPVVRCLEVDREGLVWVGLNCGVSVFFNPGEALSTPRRDFSATTLMFNGLPLLENIPVNAIVTNGANQKWIATQNAGAWLFNPTATQVIYNFNSKNSPLPSDDVTDIAINELTGEVFFLTPEGMVSYREGATNPDNPVANPPCTIFPNPVPSNYQGNIGMSGLGENVWVKITDLSNKLVHEGRANGGTYVWNGRNTENLKPEPGVYLVYSAKDDGTEPNVCKIAILK